MVSALVPYKRLELAIAAAHAAHLPLDIIGDGPERAHLEALAASAPGVRLLGRLDDEAVRASYRSALAVLLPGEEDFGLVPVEAQACGRPVVALGRGGATETVIDGVTGLLVPDDSVTSWAAALAPRRQHRLGYRPHPRQRRTLRRSPLPRRVPGRGGRAARRAR